jgi:RsiW-degrading membrane proteinase PrsW (M82 family)
MRIFTREMLADPRFLRVFALAVALHMMWNSPIELPFYLKHIVLGFVAWTAVLSFIHTGLKQVRAEQSTMATIPLPAFRP